MGLPTHSVKQTALSVFSQLFVVHYGLKIFIAKCSVFFSRKLGFLIHILWAEIPPKLGCNKLTIPFKFLQVACHRHITNVTLDESVKNFPAVLTAPLCVCFYPPFHTVQFASHTDRIDFCQTYYSLTQKEAVNFGVKEEGSN